MKKMPRTTCLMIIALIGLAGYLAHGDTGLTQDYMALAVAPVIIGLIADLLHMRRTT